jgi:uncharacterized iron-regulated protein
MYAQHSTIFLPTEKDVRILLTLLICFYATTSHSSQDHYHLTISFQPEEQLLEGKATIDFPAREQWQLFTNGLTIHKISIQEEGKAPFELPIPAGDTISMYAGLLPQRVTIVYSLRTDPPDNNNYIGPDGIALTSGWYPIPEQDIAFSLTATLPPGFKGISESDSMDIQQDGDVLKTSFSRAVQAIHLAAGPYLIEKESIRDGLALSTWFFAEDAELSREYLDAAKAYILRYEKEIGPFPYNHYAIVANRLPSGFGMPTFTLLGQMVLRLPFIKDTSLGHEILHSWFGNSIKVADESGNWCEGLTSYLADFSFATAKGKGTEHRKNSLINYQSYVHPDSAIAMQDFRSASHNQPLANAVRAVGYNRSAMFFHQLRGLLGPENFAMGIRLFASSHLGQTASWNDIKVALETVSKQDLSQFFTQQLTRKDLPSLSVTDVRTESRQDSSILHFTLQQNSEQPFVLQVPIQVTTIDGTKTFSWPVSEKETKINIPLDEVALSFSIDPEFDLFRELDPVELPPVWSRFMGAEHILLVTDDGDEKKFNPFLEWANQQGWPTIDSTAINNQQLTEHSILFTNSMNAAYQSLFADSIAERPGFHLTVQNNPLNEKEVIVLLDSSSEEETRAALRKLSHYGKYSNISFINGHIQTKTATATKDGLQHVLEELPMGGSTSATNSFDQILNQLALKQVIYLGETHDSVADHLLQLRVIQSLQQKGLNLILAMEMFPVSSQDALEEYVLEKDLDEAEFLRESHWFDVWRYDWRLFRPIFNFCRNKKIPVHGINVDREIVSAVFASGNTDELDEEQQKTIAQKRDLGINGYVERLQMVHNFHTESPHSKGKGISGFVQSQAIWDESMAKNIVKLLADNPDKTIVVLAGSQHTRKDSGIPPRVARRMDVNQASVLNLYGNNPPGNPALEADFFFMAEPSSLEAKGKIGVILISEKDEDDEEQLRVSSFSHPGKAEAAGIKENDIIISINNKPIKNMEDVGILMMDSRVGDILQMKIKRLSPDKTSEEIEIEVELSDLTKPAGHP